MGDKLRANGVPRIVFTPASPGRRIEDGMTEHLTPPHVLEKEIAADHLQDGCYSDLSHTLQNEPDYEPPPKPRRFHYDLEGGAPLPKRRYPRFCTPREQCLLKTLCLMSMILLICFISIVYLAAVGRTALLRRQRNDNTIVCQVELSDLPITPLWEHLSVLEAQKFAQDFEKDVLLSFRSHNDSRAWDVTQVIVDGFAPKAPPAVAHLHLSMRRPHFVQHVVDHFQMILAVYAEISPFIILHETVECSKHYVVDVSFTLFNNEDQRLFERPYIYKELKQVISRLTWWNEVEEMDVVDMHAEKNGFSKVVVRIKLQRILAAETMNRNVKDDISYLNAGRLGPFDVDLSSVMVKDTTAWVKTSVSAARGPLGRPPRFAEEQALSVMEGELDLVLASSVPDLNVTQVMEVEIELDENHIPQTAFDPEEQPEEILLSQEMFKTAYPHYVGPGIPPETRLLSRRRASPGVSAEENRIPRQDGDPEELIENLSRRLLTAESAFTTPAFHSLDLQIDRPWTSRQMDPYGITQPMYGLRKRQLLAIEENDEDDGTNEIDVTAEPIKDTKTANPPIADLTTAKPELPEVEKIFTTTTGNGTSNGVEDTFQYEYLDENEEEAIDNYFVPSNDTDYDYDAEDVPDLVSRMLFVETPVNASVWNVQAATGMNTSDAHAAFNQNQRLQYESVLADVHEAGSFNATNLPIDVSRDRKWASRHYRKQRVYNYKHRPKKIPKNRSKKRKQSSTRRKGSKSPRHGNKRKSLNKVYKTPKRKIVYIRDPAEQPPEHHYGSHPQMIDHYQAKTSVQGQPAPAVEKPAAGESKNQPTIQVLVINGQTSPMGLQEAVKAAGKSVGPNGGLVDLIDQAQPFLGGTAPATPDVTATKNNVQVSSSASSATTSGNNHGDTGGANQAVNLLAPKTSLYANHAAFEETSQPRKAGRKSKTSKKGHGKLKSRRKDKPKGRSKSRPQARHGLYEDDFEQDELDDVEVPAPDYYDDMGDYSYDDFDDGMFEGRMGFSPQQSPVPGLHPNGAGQPGLNQGRSFGLHPNNQMFHGPVGIAGRMGPGLVDPAMMASMRGQSLNPLQDPAVLQKLAAAWGSVSPKSSAIEDEEDDDEESEDAGTGKSVVLFDGDVYQDSMSRPSQGTKNENKKGNVPESQLQGRTGLTGFGAQAAAPYFNFMPRPFGPALRLPSRPLHMMPGLHRNFRGADPGVKLPRLPEMPVKPGNNPSQLVIQAPNNAAQPGPITDENSRSGLLSQQLLMGLLGGGIGGGSSAADVGYDDYYDDGDEDLGDYDYGDRDDSLRYSTKDRYKSKKEYPVKKKYGNSGHTDYLIVNKPRDFPSWQSFFGYGGYDGTSYSPHHVQTASYFEEQEQRPSYPQQHEHRPAPGKVMRSVVCNRTKIRAIRGYDKNRGKDDGSEGCDENTDEENYLESSGTLHGRKEEVATEVVVLYHEEPKEEVITTRPIYGHSRPAPRPTKVNIVGGNFGSTVSGSWGIYRKGHHSVRPSMGQPAYSAASREQQLSTRTKQQHHGEPQHKLDAISTQPIHNHPVYRPIQTRVVEASEIPTGGTYNIRPGGIHSQHRPDPSHLKPTEPIYPESQQVTTKVVQPYGELHDHWESPSSKLTHTHDAHPKKMRAGESTVPAPDFVDRGTDEIKPGESNPVLRPERPPLDPTPANLSAELLNLLEVTTTAPVLGRSHPVVIPTNTLEAGVIEVAPAGGDSQDGVQVITSKPADANGQHILRPTKPDVPAASGDGATAEHAQDGSVQPGRHGIHAHSTCAGHDAHTRTETAVETVTIFTQKVSTVTIQSVVHETSTETNRRVTEVIVTKPIVTEVHRVSTSTQVVTAQRTMTVPVYTEVYQTRTSTRVVTEHVTSTTPVYKEVHHTQTSTKVVTEEVTSIVPVYKTVYHTIRPTPTFHEDHMQVQPTAHAGHDRPAGHGGLKKPIGNEEPSSLTGNEEYMPLYGQEESNWLAGHGEAEEPTAHGYGEVPAGHAEFEGPSSNRVQAGSTGIGNLMQPNGHAHQKQSTAPGPQKKHPIGVGHQREPTGVRPQEQPIGHRPHMQPTGHRHNHKRPSGHRGQGQPIENEENRQPIAHRKYEHLVFHELHRQPALPRDDKQPTGLGLQEEPTGHGEGEESVGIEEAEEPTGVAEAEEATSIDELVESTGHRKHEVLPGLGGHMRQTWFRDHKRPTGHRRPYEQPMGHEENRKATGHRKYEHVVVDNEHGQQALLRNYKQPAGHGEDEEATAIEKDEEATTIEEDEEATAIEEDEEATAVEEDEEATAVEEAEEATDVEEAEEATDDEEASDEATDVEEAEESTGDRQHEELPGQGGLKRPTGHRDHNRPTGRRRPYQQPTGRRRPYQQPTGHRSLYQQPTGHRSLYQQPTGHRSLYQQPTGHRSLYQQATGHRSLYQQPTGYWRPYQQPPIGHRRPYQQPPIGHRRPYQQPTGNEQSRKPAGLRKYEHVVYHKEHGQQAFLRDHKQPAAPGESEEPNAIEEAEEATGFEEVDESNGVEEAIESSDVEAGEEPTGVEEAVESTGLEETESTGHRKHVVLPGHGSHMRPTGLGSHERPTGHRRPYQQPTGHEENREATGQRKYEQAVVHGGHEHATLPGIHQQPAHQEDSDHPALQEDNNQPSPAHGEHETPAFHREDELNKLIDLKQQQQHPEVGAGSDCSRPCDPASYQQNLALKQGSAGHHPDIDPSPLSLPPSNLAPAPHSYITKVVTVTRVMNEKPHHQPVEAYETKRPPYKPKPIPGYEEAEMDEYEQPPQYHHEDASHGQYHAQESKKTNYAQKEYKKTDHVEKIQSTISVQTSKKVYQSSLRKMYTDLLGKLGSLSKSQQTIPLEKESEPMPTTIPRDKVTPSHDHLYLGTGKVATPADKKHPDTTSRSSLPGGMFFPDAGNLFNQFAAVRWSFGPPQHFNGGGHYGGSQQMSGNFAPQHGFNQAPSHAGSSFRNFFLQGMQGGSPPPGAHMFGVQQFLPPSLGRADASVMCDSVSCGCRDRVAIVGLNVRERSRVCDGVLDCPDGTDESGCGVSPAGVGPACGGPGCVQCAPNQFYCWKPDAPQDVRCYDISRRCDGVNDCPGRKDEEHCFKLDDPVMPQHVYGGVKTEGIMYRNVRSLWYPVCATSGLPSGEFATQACIETVGPNLPSPVTSILPADPNVRGPFAVFNGQQWFVQPQCAGNFVRVSCPPPPCGASYGPSGGRMYKRSTYSNSTEPKCIDILGEDCDELDAGANFVQGKSAVVPVNDGRIVGGTESMENIHPWLVAIFHNGQFFCGGAIIHPLWVLSAGHCFFVWKSDKEYVRYQDTFYEVRAGMMRRKSAAWYTQYRHSRQVVVHPQYSGRFSQQHLFLNDIALVKLHMPFFLNKYVNRLCLPSHCPEPWEPYPLDGNPCVVAGWGAVDFTSTFKPDCLQEVIVPVMEPCRMLDYVTNNFKIQFCAGYPEGQKDSCTGDSGGPLVCLMSGRSILAGVVSHGKSCAAPNAPGVYSRVACYVTWVQEVLRLDTTGALNTPEFTTVQACPGMICSDGRCSRTKEKCDGVFDCPALGEDEAGCYGARSAQLETTGKSDAASVFLELIQNKAKEIPALFRVKEMSKEIDCSGAEYFKCESKSMNQCVPWALACDNEPHCIDQSDERCSAADIASRSADFSDKNCDGFPDYYDLSDESSCKEECVGQAVCTLSRGATRCLPRERWQDGVEDCKHGEDERIRFALAQDGVMKMDPLKNILRVNTGIASEISVSPAGIVWRPVCTNDNLTDSSLPDALCKIMTYTSALSYKKVATFNGESCEKSGLGPEYGYLELKCGKRTCGLQEVHVPTDGTAVVGVNPWSAQFYIDGKYACPGVFVSENLAAVHRRCVDLFQLSVNYGVLVAGSVEDLPFKTAVEQYLVVTNMKISGNLAILRFEPSLRPDFSSIPACVKTELTKSALPPTCEYWYIGTRISVSIGACPSGSGLCVQFPVQPECECSRKNLNTRPSNGQRKYCAPSMALTGAPVCNVDGLWYAAGVFAKETCNETEIVTLEPISEDAVNQELTSATAHEACPQAGAVRCGLGNCIEAEQVCDGKTSCKDGRDELTCPRTITLPPTCSFTQTLEGTYQCLCLTGQFTCKDGGCVDSSKTCDGKKDCLDGSDEHLPTMACEPVNILAKTNPEKICDGVIDSSDQQDENSTRCGCSADEFRCFLSGNSTHSSCLPMDKRADGTKDCTNNEDELNWVTLVPTIEEFKLNTLMYPAEKFSRGFIMAVARGVWNFFSCTNWQPALADEVCHLLQFSAAENVETNVTCPRYRDPALQEQQAAAEQYLKNPPSCCVWMNCV